MIHLVYGLIYATLLAAAPESETSGGRAETATPYHLIGEASSDARGFFDRLVARYRNLTTYSDISRVVQVIQHAGETESRRVETEMSSQVADGALRTETALSQLRRTFGLELPLPAPEPMRQAELQYQLWMLPHLTLKFSDEPLRDFRDGVHEGFTATDLAPVTVDDRPLMHLELRSGDGTDANSTATFDLFVDPESMLIERIHGHQRLPDGGNYETTVDITPRQHESDPAPSRPTCFGWPMGMTKLDTADEEAACDADASDSPPQPCPTPIMTHPADPSPASAPRYVEKDEPRAGTVSAPEAQPRKPRPRAEPSSDPPSRTEPVVDPSPCPPVPPPADSTSEDADGEGVGDDPPRGRTRL